jgi:anti-anti-sigma regulatory factor
VVLDFSGVTFIDGRGLEMLNRIARANLEIVNASLLVADLLEAGEDP